MKIRKPEVYNYSEQLKDQSPRFELMLQIWRLIIFNFLLYWSDNGEFYKENDGYKYIHLCIFNIAFILEFKFEEK